jgi:ubiquinone/menaquinone biosynthesis C-methylase UbiE
MWSWASSVLEPTRALRSAGLAPAGSRTGDMPVDLDRRGFGPKFATKYPTPRLLDRRTEHDHLVEEFDRMGEVYDAFVRPFSTPIFDEALAVMREWLTADARVLDAGCGCGRELQRVARQVPNGEVVGIDLAAGMVNAAWRDARAHGLSNTAFVQSDVGDLPAEFTGQFDLVYNCLAHHHYPQPAEAARAILRVLRPGGIYCIVDPGPEWFNAIASPLAGWGDPGWIRFHSPAEFDRLLRGEGFARVGSVELLPGFNLTVAQKRAD